jgi:hypothetical protein
VVTPTLLQSDAYAQPRAPHDVIEADTQKQQRCPPTKWKEVLTTELRTSLKLCQWRYYTCKTVGLWCACFYADTLSWTVQCTWIKTFYMVLSIPRKHRHVPPYRSNFWTNWRVFTKRGISIIPYSLLPCIITSFLHVFIQKWVTTVCVFFLTSGCTL